VWKGVALALGQSLGIRRPEWGKSDHLDPFDFAQEKLREGSLRKGDLS
jgi:hypothetical protein